MYRSICSSIVCCTLHHPASLRYTFTLFGRPYLAIVLRDSAAAGVLHGMEPVSTILFGTLSQLYFRPLFIKCVFLSFHTNIQNKRNIRAVHFCFRLVDIDKRHTNIAYHRYHADLPLVIITAASGRSPIYR